MLDTERIRGVAGLICPCLSSYRGVQTRRIELGIRFAD